jgi:hypothetical protein
MCADLDPVAFIVHFVSQLCIAGKFVCSLREAMAGSLSVAITAVSSAKVADVVSGEICRSPVDKVILQMIFFFPESLFLFNPYLDQ